MPTIVQLAAELATLPEIGAIAGGLVGGARVRVAPVAAAARAPLVAALARRHPGPLLLVASSGDAALRLADDLRQWLSPERVLHYPASDAMPYEHMSPGNDVIGRRLRALQMLGAAPTERAAADRQPAALVVVAPLKALLQPTITPAELAEGTVTLCRGDQVTRQELLRRLVGLGYRSAPTVEEPGEVNGRGDIIDVWPTADELPLRVELFDDEIDGLRRFDPGTQRGEGRLEQVRIGPPHEIPLWRRDEAVARIGALQLDTLRPEARAEWDEAIARLELGERFEGRAFYAPFFRDGDSGAATLLAHLPPGSAVLLAEAHLLEQHARELDDQAAAQRATLIESAELPPDFPRPHLRWDELFHGAAEARAPGLALADLTANEGAGAVAPPRFVPAELYGGQFRRLVTDIVARLRAGERVLAVTSQAARLQELVAEGLALETGQGDRGTGGHGDASDTVRASGGAAPPSPPPPSERSERFTVVHGALEAGWRAEALGLTLYTDAEIFGLRQRRPLSERRKKGRSADERAAFLRGLKNGDYVVHIEHGIAVYEGLIRRSVGEIEREYMVLRYAGGDKIYVPVDQIDRVARYIGAGDTAPTLTRLGTQDWERAKRKARAAVQDLAEELLGLYAQRQLKQGHPYSPDNDWQRELESSFPYIETDDQLRAISDVKADMELPTPMDRLICGDVGFGKTEVAIRAAFKAIQDGKQVAILVPTTVLAQQHFDTFRKRMAAFPVTVEMLSRFRSPKEQDAILKEAAKGAVDVLIGTHRLLSKDVRFKDLGLVIVDEEQRFGVRHKERLKQLRAEVDVLTLTATPIPRTLHMAMAGIRDLSVIDTPPEDRVPIKTYVQPYSDHLVREAILREIEREGQIYFVHNRVHSIYHVASKLQSLVPEATIGVGHGQLDERELEKVMLDFFEGRYDVLVCTTIIESGLDVSNANTIIIDDATNYGLAQLYQLRGRVGRSANRAYAYLLYKQEKRMTEEAQQRLEAIQEATELGAGFRVAMRDLEIRGAGNLLGAEQSGHIAAVGFDLYSRLLEQAVKQLKAGVDARRQEDREAGRAGRADAEDEALDSLSADVRKLKVSEKVLVSPLVTLDLPLTAYLPPEYIPDDRVRLAMYQRMVEAQTVEEVRKLRQELAERFGPKIPDPALQLLTWLQIKALALQAGVSSVVTVGDEFVIRLPIVDQPQRERLRRRFGRDASVRIGPQFVRLDRRALDGTWSDKLMGVLEVLAA